MTEPHADMGRIVGELRLMHVTTERDKKFNRCLRRLFQTDDMGNPSHRPVRFTDGTETRGVLFIEGAGGGKTTAISKGLRDFSVLAHNPETRLPRYVHSQVESPATLRSLGCKIAGQLGINDISDRAKVYEIWELVRHRLMIMDISLLWIDEAHDIFGAAEMQSMFNMLKSLMQGDHPVVLVLSGTEQLGEITRLDAQVDRRFSKIRPAELDGPTDAERVETFVERYAAKAGLAVELTDDLAQRVIFASRNRFGRCIDLTILAIEWALEEGDTVLGIEHFSMAWTEEEGRSPLEDVFERDDWLEIDLDDEAADEKASSVKRRGRRKKKAA